MITVNINNIPNKDIEYEKKIQSRVKRAAQDKRYLYVKDMILEEEINNAVIPSVHTSLSSTIVTISNSVFLPSYIVIVLHSFTCVRETKKHITLFVSFSGFLSRSLGFYVSFSGFSSRSLGFYVSFSGFLCLVLWVFVSFSGFLCLVLWVFVSFSGFSSRSLGFSFVITTHMNYKNNKSQ